MIDLLGIRENPHTVAPPDWKENGLPYGAWCRCARCGHLGPSMMTFDFYADNPGDPLVCERCKQAEWEFMFKPNV